jgi:hypothetical protein
MRGRRFLSFLAVCILGTVLGVVPAPAQQDNGVSPAALGAGWHAWSDIIANPANARNIVVCGARWLPAGNTMASFVYTSFDGGSTWSLTLDDRSTWWQTEQSCAFGAHNRVYFNSESSRPVDGDLHHELGQMHFYRSVDGGATWLAPALDTWFDHSAMTVGRFGYIYLFANASESGWHDTSRNGPAVRVSKDGGRSLTPMVGLAAPADADFSGAYPSAARALHSGRVVAVMFARSKSAALRGFDGHTRVDAVWTDDAGKTLLGPSVVSEDDGCGADNNQPAMAVDGGTPQRLYVAFSQRARSGPFNQLTPCRAMLAYSDDGGLRWTKRPVPGAGDAAGTVVAVNRRGVVGVAWSEQPGRCWKFQYSTTRGETFSKPVSLARCPRVSPNDDFANFVQAVGIYDAPPRSTYAQYIAGYQYLGLTVRSSTSQDWRSNMTASADGVFHVAWPGAGTGRLHVARASVRGSAVAVRDVQIGPHAMSVAVLPAPDAIPSWPGGTGSLLDVTKMVAITFGAATYDAAGKTVTTQFRLSNRGSEPLHVPLLWRIDRIESDIGTPVGTNARRGTMLDLSRFIPDGVLLGFGQTEPITIRFAISRYRVSSDVPLGNYRLVALTSNVWARVVAPPAPQQ